jgi:hypothetical protein
MLLDVLGRDTLDRPPLHAAAVRRVARLGGVLGALVVIWTTLPPDDRVTQLASSYGVILGGLGLLTDHAMDLLRRQPQHWRTIRRMTRLGVVLILLRVLGPVGVAWAEADPVAALACGLALLLLQVLVFSGSLATIA